MSKRSAAAFDSSFAVIDLEALDWNNFTTGCFVTSDGDAVRCDTKEMLSEEVERFPGRVFAHYGGRYDIFFLSEPKTLTLSGSGILRAQLGRASLYDSWYLFQMSLAKLGKSVGVLKFEGKSDHMSELTLTEQAEHCRQDCEVLRAALLKHRQWCRADVPHDEPRWPATAGGTAVYALEAYQPEGVEKLRGEQVELSAWLNQYAAVTGGRVELWQHGRVKGPIYSYDIRSSYPRSWVDAPLPLGPWRHVTEEVKGAAVYFARVKQSRSTLPVVAPAHTWRYDGEVWLTSEEVVEVRKHGGRVDIVEGWASSSAPVWFGNDFAEAMYAAKSKGDPWAKVSINSAHGKFGQGILQTSWVKRDGAWECDHELGFPAWHQRPLISAFVLARARIRLHQTLHALKQNGWRVLYVDTDCVHTDCPPAKFPGKLGDALGEWNHEATAQEAVYVAPKVYALRLPGGEMKFAAKGLPRKQVTFEAMLSAARGHPVSFVNTDGLVGFRRLGGTWEARRSRSPRRLSSQTGGKNHVVGLYGNTGQLSYKDQHDE